LRRGSENVAPTQTHCDGDQAFHGLDNFSDLFASSSRLTGVGEKYGHNSGWLDCHSYPHWLGHILPFRRKQLAL
jgi:hypothetical protein